MLHGLDARLKVGLTLAFVLAVALTPPGAWPVLIVLTALAISAVILAELRARFVLARLAPVWPFMLAALPLLFTLRGTPLAMLPWGWMVTREGLLRFCGMALKMNLSMVMALTLITVTPFVEILATLRSWGMPRLLGAMLGLTWRYLFVLADEAQRLMRARAARSAGGLNGHGRSVIWRARVTGNMAGNLLLRGTERAERVYEAMAARGYDGTPRVLSPTPLEQRQRAALLLGCLLLGWLILWGALAWG